ncbi:hypothetical protein ACQP2F_06625 [Actinoplanes sp. CA-030573]|uniref:hypothetical protein n=1 Tax=Actinoplanes sp. CA-030573 TaxID=3239898 RepID=UPI003D8CF63B
MDRGPAALFGAIVAVGLGPAMWLGVQLGAVEVAPVRPPAVVGEHTSGPETLLGGEGAGDSEIGDEPTIKATHRVKVLPLRASTSPTPSATPATSAAPTTTSASASASASASPSATTGGPTTPATPPTESTTQPGTPSTDPTTEPTTPPDPPTSGGPGPSYPENHLNGDSGGIAAGGPG